MQLTDFDYGLPPELIAQVPAPSRDASRLLVLRRGSGVMEHRSFPDLLEYLRPGDLLVVNDSRVLPARLRARNPSTGGGFEILLVEESARNEWWAMLRPGRRARVGTRLEIAAATQPDTGISGTVLAKNEEGHVQLRFDGTPNIVEELDRLGEVPLPPYISRPAGPSTPEDRERYQTVYARPIGSVAAPTAGLHFTEDLLRQVQARGVQVRPVTLHVGLGTFAPVKCERIEDHPMHKERFEIPESTAHAINEAKAAGRRVLAVGTTSVRVLETAVRFTKGTIRPGSGTTSIFIYPPFQFQLVDGLLTNFHLPGSTLLMLVSAFAGPGRTEGRELVLKAYEEAIRQRYRFFSYGDAMLVLD